MIRPFSSPRQRINMAKKSIRYFEAASARFFNKNPYEQVEEANPDGSGKVHKIQMTRELPDVLTDHTVTCIENLRSALDQAAFATAQLMGTGEKYTQFPFGDSETHIEGLFGGSCRHLSKHFFSFFCAFKPYQGGDDLLWALNKLCNASKHRLINPVGTGLSSIAGPIGIAGGRFRLFDPPVWNRKNNELLIAVLGEGTQLKYKLKLSFTVVFGEVHGVEGNQVSGALRDLIAKVTKIVNETETECKRLGLVT
jgi:hypothetical protein